MTPADALRAMHMLTIYQTGTPKPDDPELAADTWAFELRDFEFADVRDAIRKLCMDTRRPGTPWLVELRDVYNEVCRVRAKRLEERRSLVQPPSCLEPAEYQAWLVATDKALMAIDWTPPPAIEGTHDATKAITAALDATKPDDR